MGPRTMIILEDEKDQFKKNIKHSFQIGEIVTPKVNQISQICAVQGAP